MNEHIKPSSMTIISIGTSNNVCVAVSSPNNPPLSEVRGYVYYKVVDAIGAIRGCV